MITTADVLDKLKQQLEWRSSTGKPQGNIVLSHAYATFLHDRVLALIKQQDEHIASLDLYRENIARMVEQVERMEAKLS